jgi:methionyl-tRNA formyltransferase
MFESPQDLRIAWVGFHMEGTPALRGVLEAGYRVEGVLTLTPERARKRNAATDYGAACAPYGVPVHVVEHINDKGSLDLLRAMAPDVLFVIGWSQILAPAVLRAARIGTVGAHASLLPHNRGSAPVNWALIRGELEAGNTLMWLAEGVDTGDIIDQMRFPITPYDTCATLYDKVAESNRFMILQLLDRLAAGERPASPQQETNETQLPRRRPEHGRIDWAQPAQQVYDFIRALTWPYPGAYSYINGVRWKIWKAALLPSGLMVNAEPGVMIGSVVSPEASACGHAVACSEGALVLLEVEDEQGNRLTGTALSETKWVGCRWEGERGE